MSPIRKVDDYRAVEIDSWDEYIEEEIVGMHARGELENLPDSGKPIKIWKTEINPEYDLAFSRLKNAGVKPLWMELDYEIGRRADELWTRLDGVEALIRGQVQQLGSEQMTEAASSSAGLSLWQRFKSWFRQDFADDSPPSPTVTSIVATRERERRKFLELAKDLDSKIVTYHNSLPKGGEHLQKIRWLPERAARVFDERITLSDWWEEVRAERA